MPPCTGTRVRRYLIPTCVELLRRTQKVPFMPKITNALWPNELTHIYFSGERNIRKAGSKSPLLLCSVLSSTSRFSVPAAATPALAFCWSGLPRRVRQVPCQLQLQQCSCGEYFIHLRSANDRSSTNTLLVRRRPLCSAFPWLLPDLRPLRRSLSPRVAFISSYLGQLN